MLTPAEQKELDELEKKFGPPEEEVTAVAPFDPTSGGRGYTPPSTGLSPEEEKELQELEQRFDPFQARLAKAAEEVAQLEEKTKPSKLESAIVGASQGLTMGFGDEAAAGVESLLTGKKYDDVLERIRSYQNRAKEANPGIALGADIVSGMLIPGGAGLKGAGLASKVATSAGLGALEAFGRTEERGLGAAAEVATGGLLSGAVTGALGKLSKAEGLKEAGKGAAKMVRQGVDTGIEKMGISRKALLEPTSKKVRERALTEGGEFIDNAYALAKKENLWGWTVDSTLKKTQAALDKAGKELDTLSKQADLTSWGVDFIDELKAQKEGMLKQIMDDNAVGKLTKLQAKRTAKVLEENLDKVEDLYRKGGVPGVKDNLIASVREVKKSLGKKLRTDDFMNQDRLSPSKDQLMKSYNILRDLEIDLVEQGMSALEMSDKAVRDLRIKYSTLKDFQDLLFATATKGNAPISVEDLTKGAALGAAAYTEPVTAAAYALAKTNQGRLIRGQLTDISKAALVKASEGGKVAIDKLAPLVNVPVSVLSKGLQDRGITVEGGRASTKALLEYINQQNKVEGK